VLDPVANPNATWRAGGAGPAPIGASDTTICAADVSHMCENGFVAYWLTGRHYFYEEQLAWTIYAWQVVNSNKYWHTTSNGLYRYPFNTTRGTAWTFRNLGAMLCIVPDADTSGVRSWMIAQHDWMYPKFRNIFVTGGETYGNASAGGQFMNNTLGIMFWAEAYPQTRPWMQDFVVTATSWVADLELPISTAAQADLVTFRDHMFKQATGRCGVNPGEWHYTRAARYGDVVEECIYERAAGTRNSANLWSTWGEVWNHTLSVDGGGLVDPLPVPFPGPAEGQALDGGNIEDGNLVASYFGYLTNALVLAVDAGAAGAVAALRRIQTSPTYVALEPDFGDCPGDGSRVHADGDRSPSGL
jgi:hypothetical protein